MVIYNLIKNAIQAIPKGVEGEIFVKTRLKDKAFVITIQDNGKGIEHENLQKIFDLHYTTKPGGTGVGLYFAKETIQKKLEGNIRVESHKGKGSIFSIEIPLYINYKKSN